ncbi:helix-turn-helix transcriptional regulator [Vibrio harveyi]|nr:helix-turn-helix transcriptional regulator [Vibrio harveyi]
MSYKESDLKGEKRNFDPFLKEGKGSISDRIKLLMNGRTNRQAAKCWDIPLSTLSTYLSRGTMPSADNAFKIADSESTTVEWLLTGKEPAINKNIEYELHERILEKPKYNIAAAAGGGSFIDSFSPVEYYPFTYNYLKRNRLLHENLCVIEARGESMEPTIEDGNDLLVKLIEDVPAKPFEGVYVVSMENHLRVKRLEYDLKRDGYRVISDNKLHAEEFVSKCDFDNFQVIGEVVKVMGKPSELLTHSFT